MRPSRPSSPGPATQAAWRFFSNGRAEPTTLAGPWPAAGRAAAVQETGRWLSIKDWSHAGFGSPYAKAARLQRSHATEGGYDLTRTLLVSGSTGSPLAPMQMHWAARDGLPRSSAAPPPPDPAPVDRVQSPMAVSANRALAQPWGHVIDREGDSVGHYRPWAGEGHWFPGRGGDRCVQWNNAEWNR